MFKSVLTEFEEKLDKRFLRIHRSYIENTNKVTAYKKNEIIGAIELPIDEYYKKDVLDMLK